MIEEDKNCLDLFRYKEEKIVTYWDIVREQVPCLEILELGGEKEISKILLRVYIICCIENTKIYEYVWCSTRDWLP